MQADKSEECRGNLNNKRRLEGTVIRQLMKDMEKVGACVLWHRRLESAGIYG